MYPDGLSLTHWTTGEFASQNKLVKVLTLDYAYKPYNDVYDISITFRKVTKICEIVSYSLLNLCVNWQKFISGFKTYIVFRTTQRYIIHIKVPQNKYAPFKYSLVKNVVNTGVPHLWKNIQEHLWQATNDITPFSIRINNETTFVKINFCMIYLCSLTCVWDDYHGNDIHDSKTS